MSLVQHNFHASSEAVLNAVGAHLLEASYHYLAAAFFFDHPDVAQTNLSTFFQTLADRKREHAMKIFSYLNQRGGRVQLNEVTKPTISSFKSIQHCFDQAIQLEKQINSRFLETSKHADQVGDAQFCDFMDKFLAGQVDDIDELARHKTASGLAGAGFGEFVFNQEFYEK